MDNAGDLFDFPDETSKQRKGYLMTFVMIILFVLLIALLCSGGYLVYSITHPSDSSSAPVPIEQLSTINPSQLCSSLPSGSDLQTKGQEIYPIPDWIVFNMIQNGTWTEGCPVPIEDLTLLRLPYWNCDKGAVETGNMIVHVNVSSSVLLIFDELLISGYPIYKMNLMYTYGGDDNAAMAENNTSSFNCRPITNQPGTWSLHSYGKAIDVNTLINPYVNGDQILPPAGAPYVNRSLVVPGSIIGEGGACYDAFAERGWEWGGSWLDYQDYQHFQI